MQHNRRQQMSLHTPVPLPRILDVPTHRQLVIYLLGNGPSAMLVLKAIHS